MGRAPLPHLIALVCGFVAALAVGCGDRSNLIPANDASTLTQQLADIKAAIDGGQCSGLADRVRQFHDDATGLNGSVDSRLRKRINDGVASLQAHAVPDCEAAAAAKTQTQTQTTDTTTTQTQTDTTPTQTQTQTDTVPPDTTTTEVPTTTTPTTTTPTTTVPGGGTDTGAAPSSDNGGTPPAVPTP